MSKLLHIQSSPRRNRSYSTAVAKHFIHSYRVTHPEDDIETLDLWSFKLPEFDGATIEAKYRILHGQTFGPAEASAWDDVLTIVHRFKSAHKYLFSVPMWNFGIPYRLKHFLDVIVQPGQTFNFSPESGYTGLLTDRRAVIVCSRGGEYSSAPELQALDFQKPYLRTVLGFIGIADVQEILVEPTLTTPDVLESSLEDAKAMAADLAGIF
ncbi:NAD(P)H-dependent oxidoreductase [Candidatus Sumerlaeota bacterium]|nr:NAD(P)H-dependent oxidoreductase [Candidatus Sumerlaeota bacterium]